MHSTGHPVLRRSTEVNWGQMRSMTFADFFRVLLPSNVIWGADFDSDIHFALRRLETRSWNHRVIQGQWRHMTRKWFFAFLTPKIIHGHSKTIVTCSNRRKEHAGRWNFDLAPSEAKLSAITGFRHFSALDLTSEVTGWPKTLTLASGGGVDATPPPWVFLSCTLNQLEYHAEIFYSLWGVLCATCGEKNLVRSGQVTKLWRHKGSNLRQDFSEIVSKRNLAWCDWLEWGQLMWLVSIHD